MSSAVLQGSSVVTRDLDLWIGIPPRQYMRVINICARLGAQLHSATAVILKGEHIINFLYAVTGLNSFEYEYRRSKTIEWLGRKVRVLPVERIIKSKEAIQRPKDLAHIIELRELLGALKRRASRKRR
jgi:hypothetical protein